MHRLSIKLVIAIAGLAVTTGGQAQQTAPGDPVKPRMICKRNVETGSLVAKRRECRTKQEWDRLAEAARSNAEYEMNRSMTKPTGGT